MSGATVTATAAAAAETPSIFSDVTFRAAQPNLAICRYFQRGICRFGDMCRFSHDLTGGEVLSADMDSVASSSSSSNEHLQQQQQQHCNNLPSTSKNAVANWANAPIFVPNCQRQQLEGIDNDDALLALAVGIDGNAATTSANKSWAEVVGAGVPSVGVITITDGVETARCMEEVCPYENPCPYNVHCMYTLHWELCKMCDEYCLHPIDQAQRRKHNQDCLQQHERDMELSFAIARSKDKTCGICFDTIMEKSGREKRFGILPNCSHIFCLECIRKWRQAKQFEHKITRSCPECRVSSDFVCPSAFWVETKEDKDKLLSDYRSALGVKDCKYFKKVNFRYLI